MERDELRRRLGSAATWLDASVGEVVGLCLLAAGGVAVAGMLWWSSGPTGPATTPDVAIPTATAPADGSAGGSEEAGAEGEPADPLLVHVTGAVASPGVVELPSGARVRDAVVAAGGATADGQPDLLNLARPVVDGEQVRVPTVGEEPAPEAAPTSGGALPDGRVDLNRATAADLEALPGVGPVLAERIVAHREANGPFTAPGELREVSGIGEKTFQSMADLVVVP